MNMDSSSTETVVEERQNPANEESSQGNTEVAEDSKGEPSNESGQNNESSVQNPSTDITSEGNTTDASRDDGKGVKPDLKPDDEATGVKDKVESSGVTGTIDIKAEAKVDEKDAIVNASESLKGAKAVDERELVIFSLGIEEFGVDINQVKEINRMEKITPIPNSASYIKGVVNLRGQIIVVVCLAEKLGLEKREADSNTRILIMEINGNTIGMVVDTAKEVLRLQEDKIKNPPQVVTEKIQADYIEGVGILGERLLILLDLSKVFKKSDTKQ